MSNTLEPIYASVQGCHAVAEWLLNHPNQTWNNQTLVFLACDIKKFQVILKGVDHTEFYEPDLGGELTAMAVIGSEDVIHLTKKLKLLR